jgi:hypothetical protein
VRYDYDHGEDGRSPDAPAWYCALVRRLLEEEKYTPDELASGEPLAP